MGDFKHGFRMHPVEIIKAGEITMRVDTGEGRKGTCSAEGESEEDFSQH